MATTTTPVDLNSIFDTRDVLDRIESLTLGEDLDDTLEHDMLAALAQEMSNVFGEENMGYGITIIPDAEWVQYVKEYAEEVGCIPEGAGWPLMHIDWEAAAESLSMDYETFEFEGVSYLGRA